MQPNPPHSQLPGGTDLISGASGARAGQAAAMRSALLGGDGDSVTDIFAEALDGAMGLVRVDGGEIAMLDAGRQVMVLRARRTRPRLDPAALGGFGVPGRQSQPHPALGSHSSHPSIPSHPSRPSHPPFPSRAPHSSPLPSAPGANNLGRMSLPSHLNDPFSAGASPSPLDDIDAQSTQLLPAALLTRTYRRGERLIGLCWQRAEPIVLRGDEVRSLPSGAAPPDPEAAWHLAVPILRPGSLSVLNRSRANAEVIGVISVFIRDPLWSFSQRDVDLLTLHADRIARALSVADLGSQSQSQVDLLGVLGIESTDSQEQYVYERVRDVVRRFIDAPAFAIVEYHQRQDTVTFSLAERDNARMLSSTQPALHLPPWWGVIRSGGTVRVSTPEEHAAYGDYCALGWGGDQPAQSILAVPLIFFNSLIGAIVVGSMRPDVYAPEHESLLTSIARSTALLMQNAKLRGETNEYLAKTRDKERQLSLLNNAVLTINASLDLDTTSASLARQVVNVSNHQGCAVFLLDDSREHLVLRAATVGAEPLPLPEEPVLVSSDWQGARLLVESGQLLTLDAIEAEWTDDTPMGRLLAAWQVRSCLLLPLTHNDHGIGLLLVYSPGQRYTFTTEEIGLLHGLASQGAGAIRNAQLYAQLQAAYERQQELDRLKEEFILTVSHEFRTPVTAIEGYVTLIGRHGHKLEQAKLDQFAHEIELATNQLMGMINMLQDANSIDTAPLLLTPHTLNVREVAELALSTQSPEAKSRLQLEISPDIWAIGDAERLTHVFSNLIGNAIKYSPASLPCWITARTESRETLAAQGRAHAQAESAPARWVVVGVRDQGNGITLEDQGKLFQKFVRLKHSLTTSVRGTGLGLWICQQYVKAMGGDIWVESEYGQGSYFQFSLPAASPPATSQP